MALRQQQHQQQHQPQQQPQQQQQQQQQGSIAGTAQSPFLQWNMTERSEATLQDFMEKNSQAATKVLPKPRFRVLLLSSTNNSTNNIIINININSSSNILGTRLITMLRLTPTPSTPPSFFGQSADTWK